MNRICRLQQYPYRHLTNPKYDRQLHFQRVKEGQSITRKVPVVVNPKRILTIKLIREIP